MVRKRKRGRSRYLWEKGFRSCAYCGRRLGRSEITADHVKPLSGGGYDKLRNIVPACGPCNSEKGSMTREQYLALRAERQATS